MSQTTIHKLPQSIITKIAAGQVIERPVSVIKELIENSLDAGATQIDIEVSKDLSKLKISDNGTGMSKQDLALSFQPHTTSKIKSSDDLFNIKSLGFRGEALASIVSVALVTLASRRVTDKFGHKYVVSKSEIIDDSRIGMKPGTYIEVTQLFSAVPARRKQIKSNHYELKLILDAVEKAALSNHSCGFRVTRGSKIVLDLYPENRKKRIMSIVGKRIGDNLIYFSIKKPHLEISGYVGTPQIATFAKSQNYYFVNNRSIISNELTATIKRAYGTLIESKQFPFTIIFITLPESLIDVNIHPQKSVVKTEKDIVIEQEITTKISALFAQYNLMYKFTPQTAAKFNKNISSILTRRSPSWKVKTEISDQMTVMQLDKVYLIAISESDLFIVDQHAAHERILYNQYLIEFNKASHDVRKITFDKPKLLYFSASNFQQVLAKNDFLLQLGFTLEEFGNNSMLIREVPQLLEGLNYEQLLIDLSSSSLIDLNFKTIATMACKAAIKEGDILSQTEAVSLITRLLQEKDYATCPHGRPTIIHISKKQLDKMFKRT